MSSCKFCESERETVLVNGTCLCRDCYRDLVKIHQRTVLFFLEHVDKRPAFKELNEKLSDFSYCCENFKKSPYFVCDEHLLYSANWEVIDIFPFVRQALGLDGSWYKTWNNIIDNANGNNLGIAGCRYYYCDGCEEWKPTTVGRFALHKYCPQCYKKIAEKYQYVVLGYYKFLDETRDYNDYPKINRIFGNIDRCQDFFQSIELHPDDDVFLVMVKIARKMGFLQDNNDFIPQNIMAAVFNSYLKANKDDQKVFGEPQTFYVPDACKVCGGPIECSSEADFHDFIQIHGDPKSECWKCESWDSIEGELLKKYGWNPGWRTAIANFAKDGRNRRDQADPNKLNVYLKAQGIVMTEDVIDFWNNLFERRNGSHIIKFYAFDDNIVGKAQQQVGRAIGGLLRDLFG